MSSQRTRTVGENGRDVLPLQGGWFDPPTGHMARANAHVTVANLASPRFELEHLGARAFVRVSDLFGITHNVDAPTLARVHVERIDLEHHRAVERGGEQLLARCRAEYDVAVEHGVEHGTTPWVGCCTPRHDHTLVASNARHCLRKEPESIGAHDSTLRAQHSWIGSKVPER